MRIIRAGLLALLAFSSFSQAASLALPYGIDLLAVNGKEMDEKEVLEKLSVGKQQLVIRYSDDLKTSSKQSMIFTSKPYVLALDIKNASDTYQLSHKKFRDYDSAERAFRMKKVDWKLELNGADQSVELEELPGRDGFMPYSDIEKLIKEYNQDKGVVLTSAGAVNVTEAAITVSDSGEVKVTGDSVTQLKLWYSKASKDERKEFKKWMIDQD